jgi:hypothetical protein
VQSSALNSRLDHRALRPTLAWFENAPGPSLDAGEKTIVAERPADALGGAQPLEQVGLGLAGQQIGKAGEAELR